MAATRNERITRFKWPINHFMRDIMQLKVGVQLYSDVFPLNDAPTIKFSMNFVPRPANSNHSTLRLVASDIGGLDTFHVNCAHFWIEANGEKCGIVKKKFTFGKKCTTLEIPEYLSRSQMNAICVNLRRNKGIKICCNLMYFPPSMRIQPSMQVRPPFSVSKPLNSLPNKQLVSKGKSELLPTQSSKGQPLKGQPLKGQSLKVQLMKAQPKKEEPTKEKSSKGESPKAMPSLQSVPSVPSASAQQDSKIVSPAEAELVNMAHSVGVISRYGPIGSSSRVRKSTDTKALPSCTTSQSRVLGNEEAQMSSSFSKKLSISENCALPVNNYVPVSRLNGYSSLPRLNGYSSSSHLNGYTAPIAQSSISTVLTSVASPLDEFRQQLWDLYNQGIHDFILEAGDEKFKVSKFVLMAQSRVFCQMLCGSFGTQIDSLKFCNVSSSALKRFVEWLYLGRIATPRDSALEELYCLAYQYEIPALMNKTVAWMISTLRPENVYRRKSFAYTYNNDKLKNATDSFIARRSGVQPGFEDTCTFKEFHFPS